MIPIRLAPAQPVSGRGYKTIRRASSPAICFEDDRRPRDWSVIRLLVLRRGYFSSKAASFLPGEYVVGEDS